ncbi:MAG TPA: alpha/beta hydrolase [Aurantimonas coralicida]|uniref:Alpha/beta hydrolase n=2 Tax=root TaxID=1 RepID=A0A9C9TFT0_9HYPH|nr:alpha/beta hydrolase [Aurantimonas coralicida]HET99433.1 alpha/beta hydrolase [Aurantimonas coralicida]
MRAQNVGIVWVWSWKGASVTVGVERRGSGPTVLLLPALSSISTRAEMLPLQDRLASRFTTVAVDWPGFGDRPRPRLDWQPEMYRAFLTNLLANNVIDKPFATVAAGHAAGYALAHAAANPGALGRLCLVAPTWRGPLPTMTGKRMPLFRRLSRLGDVPVLGFGLYRLNVNSPVLHMMARGHVYSDPGWLTPARLASKFAVIQAEGARHASFRFVTGGLDPMQSRDEFLGAASRIQDPVLVVYGAETPPKSKAEMEALAELPNIEATTLPRGKLSAHEEFPEEVAGVLNPFLASPGPADGHRADADGDEASTP